MRKKRMIGKKSKGESKNMNEKEEEEDYSPLLYFIVRPEKKKKRCEMMGQKIRLQKTKSANIK